MAKATTKKILVVGDLMLDRSWVTSYRVSPTSQTHGIATPQKRFNPHAQDFRAGGAGLSALALALYPDAEVHLLSAKCSPVDEPLFELCGLISPEAFKGDQGTVCWHTLSPVESSPPLTTIKFRIYQQFAGQAPKLRERFDQDPPVGTCHSPELPISLADDYAAVLISDFNKGVVAIDLLKNLHSQYSKSLWAIDSKNTKVIEAFGHHAAGTPFVLFLNRQEAEAFAESLPSKVAPEAGWGGLRGKRDVILPSLLEVGSKCANAHTWGDWTFVVKLDEDGAVAFVNSQDEVIASYAAWPSSALDADGIGAGDVFAAAYVHHSLSSSDTSTLSALRAAVVASYKWIEFCTKGFWESRCYKHLETVVREVALPRDLSTDSLVDCRILTDELGPATEAKLNLEERSKYPNFLRNRDGLEIDLARARGYLGSFLTVDASKGRVLRDFAKELRSYFERDGKTRPLNNFVWAHPGAGKSFFAREAANYAGASFVEINISQLTSREELTNQLAYVAGQNYKNLVLLLDEVESKIEGSAIYGQLLAPLWDGVVMTARGPVNLGLRFASILVASDTNFESADAFIASISGSGDKGPDLVSRINGAVITLSSPSESDRAYMAASLIQRTFGREVQQVHFGLLDFIVKAKLEPRRIEQLLAAIKPPFDGRVTKDDWTFILENAKGWQAKYCDSLSDSDRKSCLQSKETVWIRD